MKLEYLTPSKAALEELNEFQQTNYKRYAIQGTNPSIGIQTSYRKSEVSYVVLRSEILIEPKDRDPVAPHAQDREIHRKFANTFGFLTLEIGKYTMANQLVSKKNWPERHAYLGNLTIHSWLSKEDKILVLIELFKSVHGLIGSLDTYLLTIENVLIFAKLSGNDFLPQADARLKKRSKLIKGYTKNWPIYWNQNPALHQVNFNA